ncbi:hypothetical protein STEG23_004485, partial [Scotinomys teguina]
PISCLHAVWPPLSRKGRDFMKTSRLRLNVPKSLTLHVVKLKDNFRLLFLLGLVGKILGTSGQQVDSVVKNCPQTAVLMSMNVCKLCLSLHGDGDFLSTHSLNISLKEKKKLLIPVEWSIDQYLAETKVKELKNDMQRPLEKTEMYLTLEFTPQQSVIMKSCGSV